MKSNNLLCPKCGQNSASCEAKDSTHSSDSYWQSFDIHCNKCGYKDSSGLLYSGDAGEGHGILHVCPYCGIPWHKHPGLGSHYFIHPSALKD